MKIRTREKCPKCGGRFTDVGWTYICKECFTAPTRYYIELCWKGKQKKIYSDSKGRLLKNYDLAKEEFRRIKQKIEDYEFDPDEYKYKNDIYLAFNHYVKNWLNKYEKRIEFGDLAPESYRIIERCVRIYYIPYFKDKDLRTIKNAEIDNFYHNLPSKISNSTRKIIMKYLHKILSDAFDIEYIERIPKFPRIHIEDKEIPVLDNESIQKIYKEIPSRHKDIFLFLWREG